MVKIFFHKQKPDPEILSDLFIFNSLCKELNQEQIEWMKEKRLKLLES